MKTLINKNKIRLAGGLLVLLMTVIMAVATAKSYATTCWHAGAVAAAGAPCAVYPTCCTSCFGYILWCCGRDEGYSGNTCAVGPDKDGYGFQTCTAVGGKPTTVECGVTWLMGCGPSVNVPWGYSYRETGVILSGPLTCQPESN
jgi:hypothetical protein